MNNDSKIPLNPWQKELLRSLKKIWSSVHDSKKVHADFIYKQPDENNANGKWYLNVSPILQEVLGGHEDGAKKTSCFKMDISKLILLPDWEISSIGLKTACSFCKCDNNIPSIELTAFFKDKPIEITIYLNPIHDTIEETICKNHKK